MILYSVGYLYLLDIHKKYLFKWLLLEETIIGGYNEEVYNCSHLLNFESYTLGFVYQVFSRLL